MFGRNRFAVVRPREERVFVEEVFDRNVCGPTIIVSKRKYKLRLRLNAHDLCELARWHAAPQIIQPRPAGDTVEVCINADGWQLHEFIELPFLRMFDESIY